MIIVLDTSALWSAELMVALHRANARGLMPDRLRPVLPAVAYAERARQLGEAGRPLEPWRRTLERAGIEVEPFTSAEADRVAQRAPSDAAWRAHARDFLIAAHVHGERRAVRSDDGPAWEGLDVSTPIQAAEAVLALAA